MEDNVCLDVLVSWLPGRSFNFGIYMKLFYCFFLANKAITLQSTVYILLVSPSYRRNHDSKSLVQVDYRTDRTDEGRGTACPARGLLHAKAFFVFFFCGSPGLGRKHMTATRVRYIFYLWLQTLR